MIITLKAGAGFVLLAIIVFATAQYTVSQMVIQPPTTVEKINGITVIKSVPLQGNAPVQQYRPPIVALGNNAPIIITAVIELFTLVCYLVLKKLEPRINAKAVEFVEKLKNDD